MALSWSTMGATQISLSAMATRWRSWSLPHSVTFRKSDCVQWMLPVGHSASGDGGSLKLLAGWLNCSGSVACGGVGPTGPCAGGCNATEMLLDTVGAATLIAAIVTVGDEGIVAGAVYRPVAEIVPSWALPAAVWFTVQLTVWLVEPLTVAENSEVEPRVTVADPLTDTVTGTAGAVGVVGATEVAGFEPLLLAHAVRRRSTPLTDAATTV